MSSVNVNVWVISPDTHSERRLDPHITVEQLKSKLQPITGISSDNQRISLYNSEADTQAVAQLSDDSKQLGFYGLRDWHVLRVEDANPSVSFTGQLNDYSQVEKFELSEDAYAQRQDSVLAFKKAHKVGRFANSKPVESPAGSDVDIPIGSRCEIESTEPGLHKRGTVRFYGETKFASGKWVGVEYDEPFGKNDGSVAGEQYFSCRANYGVFLRSNKVTIGDFPVLDDLEADEEM